MSVNSNSTSANDQSKGKEEKAGLIEDVSPSSATNESNISEEGHMGGFQVIESALSSFEIEQQVLDTTLSKTLKKLSNTFGVLDDCVKSHKTQMTAAREIKVMVKEMQGLYKENTTVLDKLTELTDRLEKSISVLDRIKASAPKTGP